MSEHKRTSLNPFKDDITGRLLLGRYRVVRKLAAGGMGVVYLARLEGAAGFAKPVVVKLVLPILQSNAEFSGMFAREARILADLQHPGIVGIIEFAEERDFNIMVLEYVNGFSVGDWKRYLTANNRMIPTDVAIQIAVNTADALHYAHTLKNHYGETMRIVHRDISPGNIMLDVEGHIKLVDFGIAFIAEADEGYKTTDRSFKGKLCYSSPELFSSGKASPLSDVYALGVTLHEILIGSNEFNLKDQAKIIHSVLNHVPSSVHTVRNDAPKAIDAVLRKALAKKPQDRFPDAQAFASALREISRVSEYHALSHLADLTRKDFSKDMSDFLKMESLSRRERAWRFPSMPPDYPTQGATAAETADRGAARSEISSAGEALSDSSTAVARPLKSFAKKTALIIVLLVVALAAGAGVYLWKGRTPPPDNRRFLLVQSDLPDSTAVASARGQGSAVDTTSVSGSDAAETAATNGDPDPTASAVETQDVPARTKKPVAAAKRRAVSKQDEVSRLTAAFKKKKNAVQSCFESDPATTVTTPTVAIFFTVTPSGNVERAALSPSTTEGTPLGRCLLKVSRSTVFPKRDEPVSFKIPVSARRVSR